MEWIDKRKNRHTDREEREERKAQTQTISNLN